MRPRTRHLLFAAILSLSACVAPPKPAPAPAPAPPPPPAPAPTPAPQPTYENWEDAPQTPGDWTYADGAATFGTPEHALFVVRCFAPQKVVHLAYLDTMSQPMTIRTEALDRTLAAMGVGTPRAPLAGAAHATSTAVVPADDPLLDAMAYSKGRFAVEIPGAPTLYLPAWPEVARVIEDCRSG